MILFCSQSFRIFRRNGIQWMMIDCRGITIDLMFMGLTLDNDSGRYGLVVSGTFYIKAICNHGTICH